MTEEPRDWQTPKSEDMNDPKNPPQVLLRPDSRRLALASYLGPVVVLFAVIGIALIYWANRGPAGPAPDARETDAVGTAGGSTQGGNPTREFERTSDELTFRGADDTSGVAPDRLQAAATLRTVASVVNSRAAGQPVDLVAAEVVAVDRNTISVRDGNAEVAVIAPDGSLNLTPGARVDVTGRTEREGDDLRIRATRIEIQR